MREHRYTLDLPHSPRRLWALFQDYDHWTDYAPMVKRVDVLWPGDAEHNGRQTAPSDGRHTAPAPAARARPWILRALAPARTDA